MRRITLILALLLAMAACGSDDGLTSTTSGPTTSPDENTTTIVEGTTTTESPVFPVTVSDGTGEVIIESRPERIVSLSSTATEMLFAVGAGDQVVAVDEFSTYPAEAPITDLSGFTPNLEAIVGYEPDLVLMSFDPGELKSGLDAIGIPSLLLTTALSLDDSYAQLEVIGAATGQIGEAAEVVLGMQSDIEEIVTATTVPDGISFYHEVDATLYSASSNSFLGQIYALLGMDNIADAADTDGIGFPQLASEYVVSEDPDLIFLGDVDFGVTPESLSERPGWAEMTAVQNGAIVPLEAYLASNWGPRVVELLQTIAEAVMDLETAP
ncbi:MAG: ABC transporter substrate-binding protein [Actinomycetota bacterium]|nr:ABC transporter substrate-binding protein [Actinomycetota bacterium]